MTSKKVNKTKLQKDPMDEKPSLSDWQDLTLSKKDIKGEEKDSQKVLRELRYGSKICN